MDCRVVDKGFVRVDAHGVCLIICGDGEVRELIKKLTDCLFVMAGVGVKEGVVNGLFDKKP
jgi:hypothetical protein